MAARWSTSRAASRTVSRRWSTPAKSTIRWGTSTCPRRHWGCVGTTPPSESRGPRQKSGSSRKGTGASPISCREPRPATMSQVHLGLLASGPVGIEAVGRAARLAGEDFVFLGVDERSEPDEKARFCEKAPHLDVLSLGPSFRSEELAGIEAAKVDVLVLAWWPYI